MADYSGDGLLERARALHERAIVLDTHCDTIHHVMSQGWDFAACHASGHVDLPRLRAGGVAGVFLAVWAPEHPEPGGAGAAARAQVTAFEQVVERHGQHVAHARNSAQIRVAHEKGKLALILAVEGGHLIDRSLERLREYHAHGAAYLTLTHSFHNELADSCGAEENLPPRHGGLSGFGREVVAEMNRLGMMIDVSHVSEATLRDVLEGSRAPVIASHSSCHAVSPHRRNLTDEALRAIAGAGGVVQINFNAWFVDPSPAPIDAADGDGWWNDAAVARRLQTRCTTPLARLVDHFDHALQLIGPEHVGFGSDFDGVPALPIGMEDCSKLPYLTAELLRRGYTEQELELVLGRNVLRVMDACAEVAGTEHQSA